jgi:peptidoglycan glycosyltransferase
LKSCDTSFASVGESLGPKNLYLEASAFGFDTIPPIDLPTGETAASNFPPPQDFAGDTPGLMKSAIGQENVTATTLQMALVAAGIADNGVIMTPHLLDKVIDGEGNLVETYQSHPWRRATSAATAAAVRQLMLGVTENPQGTAYGKFPPYLFPPVAAKTGTAQINAQGCGTYNWLIATAPAGAGETPTVAIAAIVPIPPGSSCVDSTGAQVAGPVVAAVMQKALAMQQ